MRLGAALGTDLGVLAGEIGERNLSRPGSLSRAAAFLRDAATATGVRVERQAFETAGAEVENLVAEVRGGADAAEIVVVGAHYDTVPGCPGANDNGSGVVAALSLLRRFARTAPRRTLRLVFFVNEEPPYFRTAAMGSLVHARRCRERRERVVAMLSLETIGCYRDEPGTQRFPFPFGLLYPSTGNFVAFVGNLASRRLVRSAIASFRAHAAFPAEGASVPSWITGVGWSDHWAFWRMGYPGIMVTDTALFRDDAYHTPRDTAERVDVARLARVVDGLGAVVADLAGTPLPPLP